MTVIVATMWYFMTVVCLVKVLNFMCDGYIKNTQLFYSNRKYAVHDDGYGKNCKIRN